MIIKAISIRQPWAQMIVQGFKTIETRSCVNLINCRPMIPSDAAGARCEYQEGLKLFAWVLTELREIRPFGVRGRPGLYEVDMEDE